MKKVWVVMFALFAIIVLTASECNEPKPPSAAQQEQTLLENQQQRLIQAIPAPTLQTSLERINIRDRLLRVNQENMISYIYLVSHGNVMAYYTVSGKVSSLNSYMTAMETITRYNCGSSCGYAVAREAPDSDGSYGKNVDGVFFFTPSGAYVEWTGDFLWSDQPLVLTQQPLLVQMVEEGE